MSATQGARLVRSAMLVAGGTAAGQLVLLLSSIAIARLFSPAQIGAFVAMSAVAAVVTLFSTGRYELAMPLPVRDEDALALGRLSGFLAAATAILLGFALAVIPDHFWPTQLAGSSLFVWAIPVLSLGLALVQIANQCAVRARLYRALATRALVFPLVAGVLQVAAGLTGAGVSGLVVAVTTGQLVAALVTWVPSTKALGLAPFARQQRRVRTIARAHWTFPAFLAPAGALNALASQLPVLLMAALFGAAVGGQFGIATKLLVAPVALLGQTVGYVYAGEVTHRGRTTADPIAPLFVRTSVLLTIVAGITAVALALGAEPIFVTLLGERWQLAGSFAVALSLGVCAQLVTAPISQTLIVAGFRKTQFGLDALRVVLIGSAAAAAHWNERSALDTVWWMSIAMAAGYALVWVANLRAAKYLDHQGAVADAQAPRRPDSSL